MTHSTVRPVCALAVPLLLVLLGAAPAMGQASTYGTGCSDAFPEPTISHSGLTTPGFPGTIHLSGAQPGGLAVLLIGTSNTVGFRQALPWDISFVSSIAAGCTLQTSAEFQLLMNADPAGNIAFPFPNLPQLGDDVYFQWIVYESQAPASLVLTQGLQLHLTNTLTTSVGQADLGSGVVGTAAAKQLVTITNPTDLTLTLVDALISGIDASDFDASLLASPPVVLAPGETTDLDLILQPMSTGWKQATLRVVQMPHPPAGFPAETIELLGIGLGPLGSEILLNAGGGAYSDTGRQIWSTDFASTGGGSFVSTDVVSGTPEQALYQALRVGSSFSYQFPLPNGTYDITLHFMDPDSTLENQRIFDVSVEGALALDDLDLFDLVGQDAAYQATVADALVSDGLLDITFIASISDAVVSAIEVRRSYAGLEVSPSVLAFDALTSGQTSDLTLTLTNVGNETLSLSTLEFNIGPAGGAGHEFIVDIDGTLYTGLHADLSLPATLVMAPAEVKPITVTFAPTEHQNNDIELVFNGNFSSVSVSLQGFGADAGGAGFLHTVIQPLPTQVDFDGDQMERVTLDGSFSHTHEQGVSIVSYTWMEGQTLLGTGAVILQDLPVGQHVVTLTIEDDNVPPYTLSGDLSFEIYTPQAVPGVLARYFLSGALLPSDLLDNVPAMPDFVELRDDMSVVNEGAIGGSSYGENVMVQLQADVLIDSSGPYKFFASGGIDRRLFVDGALATVSFGIPGTGNDPDVCASLLLSAGKHAIEARFALTDIGDLPVWVVMSQPGGIRVPITPALLTHDESGMAPVINSMPTVGFTLGGTAIDINGLGFFPSGSVTVHWGDDELSGPDFDDLHPNLIQLTAPPHAAGTIQVSVETPQGVSNVIDFVYDLTSTPPILFDEATYVAISSPTSGAWGPDGRFYVGTLFGRLFAITYDDEYNAIDVENIPALQPLVNDDILGITFNPFDPPNPVTIYISHSEIYAQSGNQPSSFYEYNGKVTVLTGPDFDLGAAQTLISGLPVSNHDHANNGIVFDNNGDLLISVGSATNAGVPWASMGLLPESPFSAAILKAETSKPGFNGAITYVETVSGLPNNDARDGDIVDVAPGVDIVVHAPGVRNAYDMVYTTKRRLYATDNGPNTSFGPSSLGPASTGPPPNDVDELLLVESSVYYGAPNPNRARTDSRQWVYRPTSEQGIPGVFTQTMLPISSSVGGIDEYRSDAFAGQLRGNLLTQRWNSYVKRLVLTPDGRSVLSAKNLPPNISPLDVRTGPGGAILGVDYTSGRVTPLIPNDQAVMGAVTVYDIFPWRAPSTGGHPFVIGGVNFGTLGDTSVTIGGLPATLTSVTSARIKGVLPVQPAPTTTLLNVNVITNGGSDLLAAAFRYLYPTPGLEPGVWANGTTLPVPLGEVAGGVIDGAIYLVGANSFKTHVFDIYSSFWSEKASRPFPGDHHSAEVVGDKLYVFGGHQNGADGKVQIYDPATNLWTAGADMPWSALSTSTALIDGLVYAAGGIAGGTTVDNCSVYDPVLDTWTAVQAMPSQQGRNHAAAGTDGEKFYIFGGRGFGSGDDNFVANGFDTVQIYDPVADSWETSLDGGSTLAPLPIGRGGMGKAVWWQDEFYIFGGETATGPGANPSGTYDRVDVYDPATNTWRQEAQMVTARHGIFPLLYQSRIFVLGGGVVAGNSNSDTAEVFTRQ
jgi:N-acetylneuraminic acid mutarotase/glucose/arabinose dehydrogenase